MNPFSFSDCTSLKDVYFEGTKAQWNAVEKGAQWNKNVSPDYREHWRCSVTFNANGHGAAPAAQRNLWANEDRVRDPGVLTDPPYYTQTGWYTDSGCTVKWDFNDPVERDMTLRAGWKKTSYDVNVITEGNGTARADYPIAEVGRCVHISALPADGWYVSEYRYEPAVEGYSGSMFVMPEHDVNVKVIFTAISKHVTVTVDGGGSAYADNADPVVGDTVTLTAVPDTGWRFMKWSVQCGGVMITNDQFVMPNDNVVVTAVFEKTLYPIAVTAEPAEGGSAYAGAAEAGVGDIVSLTASPVRGWRFKEWQIAEGDFTVNWNTWFHMPASAVALKAVFEPLNLGAITVTSDEGGPVSPDMDKAYDGETVILTVTPDPGYRLRELSVVKGGVGIYAADYENLYLFGMGAEDVEIAASFEPVFLITTDTCAYVYRSEWPDVKIMTEAAEGDELCVGLLDSAVPGKGKYFTGEYLVNGVSLGSDGEEPWTWFITEFVMPAEAMTVTAVQADKDDVCIDFSSGETADIPYDVYITLMRDDNVNKIYADDSDDVLIDLDDSGAPDVRLWFVEHTDDEGYVTDCSYYAETAQTLDAVGGRIYSYHEATLRLNTISFLLPGGCICGDANGNGAVDIMDVTCIQRTIAALSVSSYNAAAADADGNGEVTILDATCIQRFMADLNCPEGIGLPVVPHPADSTEPT